MRIFTISSALENAQTKIMFGNKWNEFYGAERYSTSTVWRDGAFVLGLVQLCSKRQILEGNQRSLWQHQDNSCDEQFVTDSNVARHTDRFIRLSQRVFKSQTNGTLCFTQYTSMQQYCFVMCIAQRQYHCLIVCIDGPRQRVCACASFIWFTQTN